MKNTLVNLDTKKMRVQNRVPGCLVVMCLANLWFGCLGNQEFDRIIEKNRKTFQSKAETGHKEIICEKLRVTLWPKDNQATTKKDDNNYEIFDILERDNQLKSSKEQAIGRSARNLKNSHGQADDDSAFDASEKRYSPESLWTSFDESLSAEATESEIELANDQKSQQSPRRKKMENYLVNSIVNILIDVNALMQLNMMIFKNLKAEFSHDNPNGCVDCRSPVTATENYLQAQLGLCGALERGLNVVRFFTKEPRKMQAVRNAVASKPRSHRAHLYAESLKSKITKLLSRVEECVDDNEDQDRADRVNDLKKYLSSIRAKKFDILDDLARHRSTEIAEDALAPKRSFLTSDGPEVYRASWGIHEARTEGNSRKIAEEVRVFDSLSKFLRTMPRIISETLRLFDESCLAGSFNKNVQHPSSASSPAYHEDSDVFEAAHGINPHGKDVFKDEQVPRNDLEGSDELSRHYDDDSPATNRGFPRLQDSREFSPGLSPSFTGSGEFDRGLTSSRPRYNSAETRGDSLDSDDETSEYFSSLFPYCRYLRKMMKQRSIDSHRKSSSRDFEDGFSSNGSNDGTGRRIRLRLPLEEARVAFGVADANSGDYVTVSLGRCTLVGKLIDASDTIDLRIMEAPLRSLRPSVEASDNVWKVPTENFINFVGKDVLKKLRETCQQRRTASPKRYRFVRTTAEYERDYDF